MGFEVRTSVCQFLKSLSHVHTFTCSLPRFGFPFSEKSKLLALGSTNRTVVTFGLVSGLRVSKVSTVTGIGGVLVAKRRTVVTFGLASGLRVSKVSTVTGIGGFLTKRRTVVAFGFVSGLRVSKVSTVTGHRDRGCPHETQNCRRFWIRLGSSRLKKVSTVTGIWVGRGRETQNCRHFWPCLWREERREREEKREMTGEKRDERREVRREKRGKKREERRDRR